MSMFKSNNQIPLPQLQENKNTILLKTKYLKREYLKWGGLIYNENGHLPGTKHLR